MGSEKTIQAGITKPTKIKKEQLDRMWNNYQKWIQNQEQEEDGDGLELYSAYKGQAEWRLNMNKIKDRVQWYGD